MHPQADIPLSVDRAQHVAARLLDVVPQGRSRGDLGEQLADVYGLWLKAHRYLAGRVCLPG